MKYEWLLFDLDNTLLDFDRAAFTAFYETLATFDIVVQPHFYRLYKKVNAKVWYAYENKKITTEALRYKRFELFLKEINSEGQPVQMSETYLSNLVKHSILLDGARELLDDLKPNYNLGIITNGLKEVQRPRLTLTKITNYFEVIIVSDEIGMAKPQFDYFDYTFAQMNRPAKAEVLVIGDSLNSDIQGGINYGLDTCWYNPNKLQNKSSFQPIYEINQLSNLKNYLLI